MTEWVSLAALLYIFLATIYVAIHVITYIYFRHRSEGYNTSLLLHKYLLKNKLFEHFTKEKIDIYKKIHAELDYEDMSIRVYREVLDENEDEELRHIIKTKYMSDALSVYLRTLGIYGKQAFMNVFFCSGLISSTLQQFIISTNKSDIERNTIVGIMVGTKIRRDTKASIFILVSLLLHFGLAAFKLINLNWLLIAILFFMIGALTINQKALQYRIKNGLYGTNPYEAREITQFILQHSDKTDFIDSNGAKKLMPDLKESVEAESIVYGGVYQP